MTNPNSSRGPLRSSIIAQGIDRATHRSLFYSMGLGKTVSLITDGRFSGAMKGSILE